MNENALLKACGSGHFDVTKLLLSAKADVDAEGGRGLAIIEHREQHAAELGLADAIPGADRKEDGERDQYA